MSARTRKGVTKWEAARGAVVTAALPPVPPEVEKAICALRLEKFYAVAHALRVAVSRLVAQRDAALDLCDRARRLIEPNADVRDGADGPVPNDAMRWCNEHDNMGGGK